MRGDEFLDKMASVDSALIQEAVEKPAPRRARFASLAIAAACLLVVLIAGSLGGDGGNPGEDPDKPGDLPMLSTEGLFGGGMGFEGYLAHDVDELIDANPWKPEKSLTTLPVFISPVVIEESTGYFGGDVDKMKAVLLGISARMGQTLDEDNLQYARPGADEVSGPVYGIHASQGGMRFEVDASLTTTITLDPAVALPGTIDFSNGASYNQTQAAAQYLLETYRAFLGMELPVLGVEGGDYSYTMERLFRVAFFEGKGDLEAQLLNYNFRQVHFHCDDQGKLFILRAYTLDSESKVGDYPIISEEEAAALLEKGNYATTAPYEMPGMEYVAKVELIYRTDETVPYYMPYYRFFVELPQEAHPELDGLKTYGAYYVPAVQGKYIEDMPLWDGRFN